MDDSKARLHPGENQDQPRCVVGLRSLGHMGLKLSPRNPTAPLFLLEKEGPDRLGWDWAAVQEGGM